MKKKNTMAEKIKKKSKKMILLGSTAMTCLIMQVPVYAATFKSYDGTNATKIMDGAKNLFGTIGTWGGGLYAVAAIFTLILAIRNEDNEGRNKAILNLLAAIALLSMGAIIKLFFK